MNTELRKLSAGDGMDVYAMLQEIPKDENGFINGGNGLSYGDFKAWLVKSENTANGKDLESWMVSQDIYWLYADKTPVGFGKLRCHLTEKLREDGGHIGYVVRPSCRGKGYGKILLKQLVEKASEKEIGKLLLTVENHNHASIAVALANGGVVERVSGLKHYIWIDSCKPSTTDKEA